MIVSDIIKGRGQFAAEWMLVAQKVKQNSRWVLKPINFCLNHYGNEPIEITKKVTLELEALRCKEKEETMGGILQKCYSSR